MIPLPAEYQLGPNALEMLGRIDGPPVRQRRLAPRVRTVLVPTHLALVLDRHGWRLRPVPPQWWIDMLDPEFADAPEAQPLPTQLADDGNVRRSSCRPGHGPCRRRHEHTSRRTAAA